MKFLIAGYGSIGRRHLRNLRALGEQDILLYRSRRSTLPDDEIAGLPVETDLYAALARQPDAVIISNPTALHLDVAIPAAEMGCAILMEKPVSNDLARLVDLRLAIKRSRARLMVGFQLRFHPTLQIAARPGRGWHHRPARVGARPLGRIPAQLAPLGGLPPGLRRPSRPGRRGHL